jgi:thiamine-phosphate pyrophosphorylase
MMPDALKLCLVTQLDHQDIDQYCFLLKQAIQGGVSCIQFRDKNKASANQTEQKARALKEFLAPFAIPFIINDRVTLAHKINADGVHLGQEDCSPLEARSILGPDKIIGYSIETLEQLEAANQLSCIDYVAASAVFPSKSKNNCKTIWGLAGLKQLAQFSKHPVIAIGGINQANAHQIIAHGASGIAVISAIHEAQDPKLAAYQLRSTINV